MEEPPTPHQHGAAECQEKPAQSLRAPKSEGKVGYSLAEVLKHTMDLDHGLGKCNARETALFCQHHQAGAHSSSSRESAEVSYAMAFAHCETLGNIFAVQG